MEEVGIGMVMFGRLSQEEFGSCGLPFDAKKGQVMANDPSLAKVIAKCLGKAAGEVALIREAARCRDGCDRRIGVTKQATGALKPLR